MRTLNLGILAHVDAGKTSLTERLLYATGAIDHVGSVDDGSTRTDTLDLERRRGITIRAAVESFIVDDTVVNLIDTPGHPDFIAEVERSLSVLDGAILVLSAVEGVQAQTRILMRALRRLGIPTLLFVNKLDRMSAQGLELVEDIKAKLTPAAIAMGDTDRRGTADAGFSPYGADEAGFLTAGTELVAEHDDAVLAAYLDGRAVPYPRLRERLAELTGQGLAHPVFAGSAITGAGVDHLIEGVEEFLPSAGGDPGAPVDGRVFKIDLGPAGEKVAYVRMFSGTLRLRQRVLFGPAGGSWSEAKVTQVEVLEPGGAVRRVEVGPGRIGRVRGLEAVRIGDHLEGEVEWSSSGSKERRRSVSARETSVEPEPDHWLSAPPSLQAVVVPADPADAGRLHVALTRLTEADPLIGLRQDGSELTVSIYGEVQKEVIAATLTEEYGIEVEFRPTSTICVERPRGVGQAVEYMRADTNPYLATVGLRVEPTQVGAGVSFELAGIVHGTMPPAFFKAVEETVLEGLRGGVRRWEVVDCAVTMTHTGYAPRQSHAHQGFNKAMSSTGGDFRSLTPIVLARALEDAGTVVYEPIHRFELEIPAETVGTVLPVLGRYGAIPRARRDRGPITMVEGEMPAARVDDLRRALPGMTGGEGVLEVRFDHDRPVRDAT